jgi:hypothetical protein
MNYVQPNIVLSLILQITSTTSFIGDNNLYFIANFAGFEDGKTRRNFFS